MAGVFAFGKDLWDPSHRFETSWLLPPYILGFIRALFGLYAIVVELFILGWYCSHEQGCTTSGNQFSYFTVLTYWGLGFYFSFAALHTLSYARTGTPVLDRFPRPLQALHSFFYTSVVVYPFVVTIVYWGRLYQGPWFPVVFNAWSNVSQHLLNSLFAFFEIIFTRTNPPPAVHMLWLILVLALYLGLAYLTRATKGFYVYVFLDPVKTGSAYVAAYVFGIAVGSLIIFGFAWVCIWFRKWVTEDKFRLDGKFAKQPNTWRDDATGADPDLEMSGLGDHAK